MDDFFVHLVSAAKTNKTREQSNKGRTFFLTALAARGWIFKSIKYLNSTYYTDKVEKNLISVYYFLFKTQKIFQN